MNEKTGNGQGRGTFRVPPHGKRDFGEHIGGAMKDRRGGMASEGEGDVIPSRRGLWPREDPWRAVASGRSPEAALFRNEVRKCIVARSPDRGSDDGYRALAERLRELSDCITPEDVESAIGALRDTVFPDGLESDECLFVMSHGFDWYVAEASARGYTDSRTRPPNRGRVVAGWVDADGVFHIDGDSGTMTPCFSVEEPDGTFRGVFSTVGGASDALAGGLSSKRGFRLPHVAVERTGCSEIRTPVTPKEYLGLGIRGGEFGNWLTASEYTVHMDACYSALVDLADVLGVERSSVSFGGMALAFGSRGSGWSSAHYEPRRRVINITRNTGAGCLAHEMGHALDHMIGIRYGDGRHATSSEGMPRAFTRVMDAILYRYEPFPADHLDSLDLGLLSLVGSVFGTGHRAVEATRSAILSHATRDDWLGDMDALHKAEFGRSLHRRDARRLASSMDRVFSVHSTDVWKDGARHIRFKSEYRVGSRVFGGNYSRNGHGYWDSPAELFARAFDCHVSDRLAERGMTSTYLTSHADSFSCVVDGVTVRAYPSGAEREAVNAAFDGLFDFLKKDGVLEPRGGAD